MGHGPRGLQRHGNAWDYFTHDQARSRAYRWGEDGLAGVSDDRQILCFALALWNGADPILKERLFGLTNSEGNHGEDVKEYYFYLDSTPTHSYMKYLYKYPQAAYPVRRARRDQRGARPQRARVRAARHRRVRRGPLLRRVRRVREGGSRRHPRSRSRSCNRGPEAADAARAADAVVPQHVVVGRRRAERPSLRQVAANEAGGSRHRADASASSASATSTATARRRAAVHRERDEHRAHLRQAPNRTPYVKDGINDYIVHGRPDAVNPEQTGTKAAAHYRARQSAPGESQRRAAAAERRGRPRRSQGAGGPFGELRRACSTRAARRRTSSTPTSIPPSLERRRRPTSCARRSPACCGRSSSTTTTSTGGSTSAAAIRSSRSGSSPRNEHWHHMYNADVISMPDKWEYPWYAAWDLAFHVLALTLVDEDFGKQQLDLMLREQLPAPERPAPGVRVELRRRQSAGARVGDDLHLSTRAGASGRGRRRVARALLPQAAAELHVVGESQGPHAAATSSRAGSSASTTSACSTAAHRCRPAATSSRPTARPGWRSSARTCSRSRSSSRSSDPSYATMAQKFARALPVDRVVDDSRRRRRRACGTRRTASSTTCCGCPMAARSG